MTLMTANAKPAGGIDGTGNTLIVDHTTDNSLVSLRFKHANVKMRAAEEDFEAGGRKFRAGAFIIANADRAALEPTLKDLSLTAMAVTAAPTVKTHELDVPRIGYVHSWARTQDEGWVRAAFDHFGVPYTYFSDIKLREGNLRSKYDVIVFPHVGGTAQQQVNGLSGPEPVPYKKSELTPNLGAQDQADDIRGGMGMEGLLELAKFVREGGTLLVEGSTSRDLPRIRDHQRHHRREPDAAVRARVDHARRVCRSKEPDRLRLRRAGAGLLQSGSGAECRRRLWRFWRIRRRRADPGVGQNTTPMATRLPLSVWEPDPATQKPDRPQVDEMAQFRQMARQFGIVFDEVTPRVVMRFPQNPNDMLLSGTLAGGQFLANRAQVVDAPLGKGHVVMFAIRPFWRWQTQGTYFLGFNTILNWNDLDAGKPAKTETNQQ